VRACRLGEQFGRPPAYGDVDVCDWPCDFALAMDYRMRYDNIAKTLATFSGVPVPGWRILLSPVEFNKWVQWAQRVREQQMKSGDGFNAMGRPFADPWLFDTADEFISFYGG